MFQIKFEFEVLKSINADFFRVVKASNGTIYVPVYGTSGQSEGRNNFLRTFSKNFFASDRLGAVNPTIDIQKNNEGLEIFRRSSFFLIRHTESREK